jgi:hypothetical protein
MREFPAEQRVFPWLPAIQCTKKEIPAEFKLITDPNDFSMKGDVFVNNLRDFFSSTGTDTVATDDGGMTIARIHNYGFALYRYMGEKKKPARINAVASIPCPLP